MNIAASINNLSDRLQMRPAMLWGLALALVSAAAVGLMMPLHVLALISLAMIGATLLAFPELATLAVLFVIYTNAAVVAVKFHGVPLVVGGAVPLLLGVPLVNYFLIRRQKLIVDNVMPLILLFIIVQLFGSLFASRPEEAVRQVLESCVEGLAMYFLVINIIRTPETMNRVIWVLLMAGAFMGSITTYQKISGQYDRDFGGFGQLTDTGFAVLDDNSQTAVTQRRLSGPIGETNRFAQIMLMLLPLGIYQIRREPRLAFKAAALGLTLITALGCAVAFSRGAAVGLGLMLVVGAVLGYVRLREIAAALAVAGLVLIILPEYKDRMATMGALRNITEGKAGIRKTEDVIQNRVTEMLAAGNAFSDHPLWGIGTGMFKYYSGKYSKNVGLNALKGDRQAHNLYLGILAENGIVGFGVFMAIVGIMLRSLVRVRRRLLAIRPDLSNLAGAFILVIVAYLTTGMFLHLAYVRYFWLMLALAGAVCYFGNEIASRFERHVKLDAKRVLPAAA